MPELHRTSLISAALVAILGLFIVLGATGLSVAEAEDTEDLSDNETCFDCHLDEEHLDLLEVDGAQVHNPEDGSLKAEAHTEFACIDCHMDIVEIPHIEDVKRTVNCTDCHDETPQ
jgi:hypothetical protein